MKWALVRRMRYSTATEEHRKQSSRLNPAILRGQHPKSASEPESSTICQISHRPPFASHISVLTALQHSYLFLLHHSSRTTQCGIQWEKFMLLNLARKIIGRSVIGISRTASWQDRCSTYERWVKSGPWEKKGKFLRRQHKTDLDLKNSKNFSRWPKSAFELFPCRPSFQPQITKRLATQGNQTARQRLIIPQSILSNSFVRCPSSKIYQSLTFLWPQYIL